MRVYRLPGLLVVLASFLALSITHLFAPAPARADIVDGAPAIDLLGHYDQTSLTTPVPAFDKRGQNDSPNRYGLNQPQGVALDTANHRLFVSDFFGNRVLVFNLDSANRLVDPLPDFVLGQPDFNSGRSVSTDSSLRQPQGLAYDPERELLFVADFGSGRVLVFDVAAITSGESAVAVLGQPDFTSQLFAPVSASLLSTPVGLTWDVARRRLYVSDTTFNRITVFDLTEITNGEAAIHVLGQPDFVTTTGGASQSRLIDPLQLSLDSGGQRLFVAEAGAHRVMVFDVASIVDGENAVNVVCQSNFTTITSGTAVNRCNAPEGVWYDLPRERLYVAERGNQRVHVFNIGTSFSNGPSATAVLGQSTLGNSGFGATSRSTVSTPSQLTANPFDGRLYLADAGNNRVLTFDAATVTSGEDAEALIGQYDETSYAPPVARFTKSGGGNSPNRFGLSGPRQLGLDSVRHRLFVTDAGNGRVLVHQLDSSDRLIDYIPDAVLGQVDLASRSITPTAASMLSPEGLAYDPVQDRLFVSDEQFHRILVFNTAVIDSGEAAVSVLGQTDFTNVSAGLSANRLAGPRQLAFDPARNLLFAADKGNSRVLVYDVGAITNGESAVRVLGQTDFTTGTFGLSATQLNGPAGLAWDAEGNRLFVADTDNYRVLAFDLAAVTNGEAAVKVLCQSSFTTDFQALTRAGCSVPAALAFDSESNHLHVADTGNYRVLTFDTAAITNGEDAIHVLGQANFTTSEPDSGPTLTSETHGLAIDARNDRLYVADDNGRIVIFPLDYAASYSGRTFAESGSTTGAVSTVVTLTLRNEFFAVSSGVLTRNTHYTIGALPAGLTEAVTVTSPTTATIRLTGTATANLASDSVSNIAFTILDAGLRNVAAENVRGLATTFGITFSGVEPCFGGVLGAPRVRVRARRATVTLPGGVISSSACEVTLRGERSAPRRRLSKRITAGRTSATFSGLVTGTWRFLYTVKTTGLGTTQTSAKKRVLVR